MFTKRLLLFTLPIFISTSLPVLSDTGSAQSLAYAGKAHNTIDWQPWSDDVFARAKAENKLVILDLHAVWCHWCHVMDEQTYKNSAIMDIINKYFIPVSVDQDSRPDLASRYQDFGWPATVIFNSEGKEREILSGYYPVKEFLPILRECVKNPNNIDSKHDHSQLNYSNDNELNPNLKEELSKKYKTSYDTENGGWTLRKKFLSPDEVEYAMVLAYGDDADSAQKAKEVLNLQNNLLDPVWGGMYQYSTDNDWQHPHFEKIMSVQANNLRIYSLAYLLFQDPAYLNTAQKIYQYLSDFLLSPEGAFYTSQDADLIPGQHSQDYFALDNNARRKLGLPKIDQHIYSRENGWAIEALVYLYAATGEKKYLNTAITAANWIIANRTATETLGKNGFVHEKMGQGLYLSDNISMGKAFLALYSVTGDRNWLKKAEVLGEFIANNFALPTGFATSKTNNNSDNIDLDENIAITRFYNMLFYYTGESKYHDWSLLSMHYLSTPAISKDLRLVGGILLADYELAHDPFHIVIVGPKGNADAFKLFMAAQQYPIAYRQIEWLDSEEGSLPGQTIEYPQFGKPAAFTCASGTCSSPMLTPDAIKKKIVTNNKLKR